MLVGKEYRGAHFEASKTATERDGGKTDPSQYQGPQREKVSDDEESIGKAEEQRVEKA